jgi:hypothetical protein
MPKAFPFFYLQPSFSEVPKNPTHLAVSVQNLSPMGCRETNLGDLDFFYFSISILKKFLALNSISGDSMGKVFANRK